MNKTLLAYLYTLLLLFSGKVVFSQTGVITGVIKDRDTQATLVGVSVVLEGTEQAVGAASELDGSYKIVAPTGSYTIKASFVGYKDLKKFNIVLTSGNASIVNFELEEELTTLNEVVVQGGRTAAVATLESPLSIQKLSTEEIRSNPGGNFDISRVIQSLPGVSSSPGGVRNDIIIRGGAPNENVYYLDGIEVPVINHFTTQGSSGGPQGILNVSFIEDVTLSTSAFNAKYDNALSSVFQFVQRDGNKERLQGNIRLSGTELATTFDGPISSKTTFLASARRSYLQYFFKLIDLPIRPSYWDFQFKITHQLNAKTTLTAIGLGAIDDFTFAVPKESTPEKEYVLRSNPLINQNSYTVGLALKRLLTNGYLNIALSRNYFSNQLDKFEDGQNEIESLRTLKSTSDEIENKLRVDVNKSVNGWKYSYGLTFQYVQFTNNLFNKFRKEITDENGNIIQPGSIINFNTAIDFIKYGAFTQLTKTFFDNRFSVSGGVRTDLNSFTTDGGDPVQTISPRVSFSYAVNDQWNINASLGQYYKTPIYTVLGFKDNQGNYVNKDSKYIRSTHYVAGIEYLPNDGFRFTAEGFYKNYDHYPVSINRGISLANEGAEFGAIGNEAISSTGKGRSFGVELFIQKKLTKNTFYVISYTWYKSEFTGADDEHIASAWDNRNLVSGLLGKKFKKGWEFGLKFRYAGGAPYTPFDLEASQRNYLSLGTGVLDLSRLNAERLDSFNQLDLRIDKKWNYKRLTLDLYLDIQNLLVSKTPSAPDYTFERNEDSTYKTTDGEPIKADGSNAIPIILKDDDPFFVPTIGFILEF
ncbi:TonB-dependent receptor [Chryseolinea sp. H1M3-3]|uniref:TonB-dependent receptor n=1 Tax=Chryseolinea sp. H1M3-3 TaxID=3034144 RepID=UPI0023EAEF88|nr:TonB-dependent receptor [Chryseolinea sp. H1M3-3]